MKAKIKTTVDVELKTLHVSAGVRYWEDTEVNGVEDTEGTLIPFRNGEYWEPIIDLDKGQVIDWPVGTTAKLHYKVCDDGTYTLKDEEGNPMLEKSGYVPKIMCPAENGDGDYIIMDIDENGFIKDWKVNIKDFDETEDDE